MLKQVIIMRDDLNMRRGKEIAQGGHAVNEIARKYSNRTAYKNWVATGQTKICVRISGEDALRDLAQKAHDAGLPYAVITDAGHTEFKGKPTLTCMAIGPAPAEKIDPITGHLKLY